MMKSDPLIDPVELLLRSLVEDADEWAQRGGAFHRLGISIKPVDGLFGLRRSAMLTMDGVPYALQRDEQLSLSQAVENLREARMVSGKTNLESRSSVQSYEKKSSQHENEVPKKNIEIKSLTSLRGIAAIMVVLQHFSTTAQDYCNKYFPSLAPRGYMAVDFFFVLSGFIITYTYLTSFEKDGMRAFGPFLLKRVGRIAPLGLATLTIILILGGIASYWGRGDLFINGRASEHGLLISIIFNILHLQGFLDPYNLNDPSWSISIEMAAYVLFPLLIYVFFNESKLFSTIFALIGTAFLVALALSQPRFGMALKAGPVTVTRSLIEFGYGMIVYRLFRTSEALRFISSDRWTWSVSAFALAMLALRLDLFAALSFPAVVLAWASNQGSASKIMSSRIPYFLGEISFSIYLVHHMFRRPEMAVLKHFFPQPVPPSTAIAFVLLGSISIVPAAVLAFYYIEQPGRAAMRMLVNRKRSSRFA